jgi:cell fate regulator YaaT (PSP1 superfamily)
MERDDAPAEFAFLEEFEFDSLPDALSPEGSVPTYVAHVRLPRVNRVALFDAGDLCLRAGDLVVVETDRGLSLGPLVSDPVCRLVPAALPRVLRAATPDDLRQAQRNCRREEEAYRFCCQRIRERGMPMKLVGVEYLHGGNKAVFYFSADGRVDFRELVKDLAYRLHTRVEMRQIGVRDASKVVGGLGVCGRILCCASWLQKFEPVSIRMAKVQNLSLNPQKVSGACGRLLCCLAYEQETYQALRAHLPRLGKSVMTPRGEGKVTELDVLGQKARVTFADGSILEFEAGALRGEEGGDERNGDDLPEEVRALDEGVHGGGRGSSSAEGRAVRVARRAGRSKPWQDGRVSPSTEGPGEPKRREAPKPSKPEPGAVSEAAPGKPGASTPRGLRPEGPSSHPCGPPSSRPVGATAGSPRPGRSRRPGPSSR